MLSVDIWMSTLSGGLGFETDLRVKVNTFSRFHLLSEVLPQTEKIPQEPPDTASCLKCTLSIMLLLLLQIAKLSRRRNYVRFPFGEHGGEAEDPTGRRCGPQGESQSQGGTSGASSARSPLA